MWYQELKSLLQLATPIFIAQISFTSMGFVDSVMAGRYSDTDLAAIAIGGAIWLPSLLFAQALLFSVSAKLAPLWGAKQFDAFAGLFHQGLLLALISGCSIGAMLYYLSGQLHWFDLAPELTPIANEYLWYLSFSIPVASLYQVFRGFIEASGQTKPIMLINFLGLLANIPLNAIFIFGYFGAPAMGGAGCGLATLLAFCLNTVLSYLYIRHHHSFRVASLRLRSFRFSQEQLKGVTALVALGLPIALGMLAEVALFTVIALLIAPLGILTIASHQIAISITTQIFMLPFSQSNALAIRIGHLWGQQDFARLRVCVQTGLGLALFIALISALGLYAARFAIAEIYTQTPEIIATASLLVIYAAIYQIPDALQVCSNGILRALHVVKRPLAVILSAYWGIALPIGYVLCFHANWLNLPGNFGVEGFWIALVIGLSLSAIGLFSLLVWVLKRLPITAK